MAFCCAKLDHSWKCLARAVATVPSIVISASSYLMHRISLQICAKPCFCCIANPQPISSPTVQGYICARIICTWLLLCNWKYCTVQRVQYSRPDTWFGPHLMEICVCTVDRVKDLMSRFCGMAKPVWKSGFIGSHVRQRALREATCGAANRSRRWVGSQANDAPY